MTVQIAGGLVSDDEVGVVHESTGNGDALGLAAGQSFGIKVFAVLQADTFQGCRGLLEPFGLHDALVGQGQRDVFERGEARQKVKRLEDKTNMVAAGLGQSIGTQPRDQPATKGVATMSGAVEQTNNVHEGGFAGAGGPHDGHELTLFNGEADFIQGYGGGIAKAVELGDFV